MKRAVLLTVLLLILLAAGLSVYVGRVTAERDAWNKSVQNGKRAMAAEGKKPESGESEAVKTVSEGKASFYQKLHDSEKVRILILGDHFAESSGLPDGVESWTAILQKELSERYGSEVEIVNLALPEGNDAYSAYVQLENAPKDESMDAAILCLGSYDESFSFRLRYEGLLRTLRLKYEKCSLISLIESVALTDPGRNADETASYIRELTEHYQGLTVNEAEAYAMSGEDYSRFTGENHIPNAEGQKLWAKWILDGIAPLVSSYQGYDSAEIERKDPDAAAYDHYFYVPSSAFSRIDDHSFRISAAELQALSVSDASLLGIDWQWVQRQNDVNALIDGQLPGGRTENYSGDQDSERHIQIIGDGANISSDLTMTFASEQQADQFKGVIFSGSIPLTRETKEREFTVLPAPAPMESETAAGDASAPSDGTSASESLPQEVPETQAPESGVMSESDNTDEVILGIGDGPVGES